MIHRRSLVVLLSLSFFILALHVTMNSIQGQQPSTPKTKVLRHIVMYKFKEDQSKAQIQEVIDAFAGLPKKIDTIIGFEHGTNVSPEGKSDGFTHCFVVTFKNEADRDAYLKHPAHDDYVKVVKDRREKVIVFDYWADR
jgi:heme-degrading monooxygenase HmoA